MAVKGELQRLIAALEHQETTSSPRLRDLTEDARAGRIAPVVGRDPEIEESLEILNQRRKANVMLIGPAGAGKTAVAEGLALLLGRHGTQLPGRLRNARLLSLSTMNLVAGTGIVGELEQRLARLFDDAESSDHIIFIDEVHTLIGAGGPRGHQDVANLIKPYLAREGLRVIGATTDVEYSSIVAQDPAFERRFTPVHVRPFDVVKTCRVLSAYARHRGARIADPEILTEIARRAEIMLPTRALPDSAMDVLERSLSLMQLHQREQLDRWTLERALLRAARLPPDVDDQLACLAAKEPPTAPVVEAIRALLRGERQPPVFIDLAKLEQAEHCARALGTILGSHVEIDLAAQSPREILGAEPGLLGYGERRPLHALLEHPFTVLLLAGIDEAGPNASLVSDLRRLGRVHDTRGRSISAMVVITAPVTRRRQAVGFA